MLYAVVITCRWRFPTDFSRVCDKLAVSDRSMEVSDVSDTVKAKLGECKNLPARSPEWVLVEGFPETEGRIP